MEIIMRTILDELADMAIILAIIAGVFALIYFFE